MIAVPVEFGSEDPAAAAARAQIRRLLEHAIDELPEPFRIVFVMREIEECTVEETAASLDLQAGDGEDPPAPRAPAAARGAARHLVDTLGDAFPFLGPRCDRMTEAVMQRLEGGNAGCTGRMMRSFRCR